uniref:(northern house mosquito) hypothetical protein n=1 Tax=Culex pipiens TaxID=7175 RepID=A0A8D8HJQ8_CULPI
MHHMLSTRRHHPLPLTLPLFPLPLSPFPFLLLPHLPLPLFLFPLFLLPLLLLALFLLSLFLFPLFPHLLLPFHHFACLPGPFLFPHPGPPFLLLHLQVLVDALRLHAHAGNHPRVQIWRIRKRRVERVGGRVVIRCTEHLEARIQVDGRIVVGQRGRVEEVAWRHSGNRPERGTIRIHRKRSGRMRQPFVGPVRLEATPCQHLRVKHTRRARSTRRRARIEPLNLLRRLRRRALLRLVVDALLNRFGSTPRPTLRHSVAP